jgi:hypothetical protein
VPGFILRSIPTATNGATMPWLGNYTTDHRSRIEERWGGWYVTGDSGSTPHLGNVIITNPNTRELPSSANRGSSAPSTLSERVNSEYYLSPHSDIVALLVFDHQARMMNLLIRIGWEARVVAHETQAAPSDNVLRDLAVELVDYLLFIDEAPLDGIRSVSPFAKTFSARGPRDRHGRSLRDLDLQHRLMRHPCSYMIYSTAFDGLPAEARDAIYRRMSQVLSGQDRSAKYSRLSKEDRRAIVEILRDTKQDLPSYFVIS